MAADPWEVIDELPATPAAPATPAPAANDPWAVVGEAPTVAAPRAAVEPRRLVPGNIDLTNRPHVLNPDGTTSTLLSKSFEIDGREVLLPTIAHDGRVMDDAAAVDEYKLGGGHLGIFSSPEAATAFAQLLHEDQARKLSPGAPMLEPQRSRRVSAPAPLRVPTAGKPSPQVDKPFDPYGGYFSDQREPRGPESLGVAAKELLVDPLVRGYRQTAQASNVLSAGTGLETPESAAHDIATRQAELAAMPVADYRRKLQARLDAMNPATHLTAEEFDLGEQPGYSRQKMIDAAPPPPTGTAALANPYGAYYGQRENMPLAQIQPGPSVPQVMWEYAKDPRNIVDVALESGSASLSSILLGAGGGAGAGLLTSNPLGIAAGAALGAGGGSFLVEFGSDVLDTFRKNGVNLSKEEEILAAFNNPDLMSQAREHAAKRGAAVALFDALSAGLAGRTAGTFERAAERMGAGKAAPLIGEFGEVVTQGGLGGAGEAAGSMAVGEKVDPVAVAQEWLGELGTGTAEILYGRAQDQAAQKKQAEEFELTSPLPADIARLLTPPDPQGEQREAPFIPDSYFTPELPLREELTRDMLPAPGTTGSPAPEPAAGEATAPRPAAAQGTATPPPRSKLRQSEFDAIKRHVAELPPEDREFFLESLARYGSIARNEIAPLLAEVNAAKPAGEAPFSSAFEQPAPPVSAAPPASPAPNKPAPTPAPQVPPAVSTAQEPPAGGAASPTPAAKETKPASPPAPLGPQMGMFGEEGQPTPEAAEKPAGQFANERAAVADFIKAPKKFGQVKGEEKTDAEAVGRARELQPKLDELEALLAKVPAEKLSPERLSSFREAIANIATSTNFLSRRDAVGFANVDADRLIYEAKEIAAGRVPEPTPRQQQLADEKAKAERKAAPKAKPAKKAAPVPPAGLVLPEPPIPRMKGTKPLAADAGEATANQVKAKKLWLKYQNTTAKLRAEGKMYRIAKWDKIIADTLADIKNSKKFSDYGFHLNDLVQHLAGAQEEAKNLEHRRQNQASGGEPPIELPPPPKTKGKPAPKIAAQVAKDTEAVKKLSAEYDALVSQFEEDRPSMAEAIEDKIAEAESDLNGASTFREHADAMASFREVLENAVKVATPKAPKALDPDRKFKPGELEKELNQKAGVVVDIPTTEAGFQEAIDTQPELFASPDVMVHATDDPTYTKFISPKEAEKRIEKWQAHAQEQGINADENGNSTKVILSLFDLTGNWSKPYKDAGYDVIPLDLQNGDDIRDFIDDPLGFLEKKVPFMGSGIHGMLIAAPCTHFSSSGAHAWKQKDADGRTEAGKDLVIASLQMVDLLAPKFWALENPVGRIRESTGLPDARFQFDPYDFGDPYTKQTQLYGNFNTDLPTAPVEPTEGSKMHDQHGGASIDTKNARSVTPEGFAYSFFMANNAVDAAEQTAPKEGKRKQQSRPAFTRESEKKHKDRINKEREARKAKRAASKESGIESAMDESLDEEEAPQVEEAAPAEEVPEETTDDETEAAAGTDASSRRRQSGEKFTPPSTSRENLMSFLNIDPKEFRALGGKAQWDLAVEAIKKVYGYADIIRHPRALLRNSVDHLLDGFESLQNLASVLRQGARIVSLNGRITLHMREKPGKTMGYFRYVGHKNEPNNTIAIFNQEDVYSHELAHALDYDLMERGGGNKPGALSRMIRERENAGTLPKTLLAAFADVMTALYYDGAHIAALIHKAEHQLKNSKTPTQQARLQKRLDNLRSGAWSGKGGKTDFYKRAQNGPLARYLTKPTELFARVVEAYISAKVEGQQAMGLVKFLGATDAIYRNDANAWIKRTYPHGTDRQHIFSTLDNLFGQLMREDIYNVATNSPGIANSQVNLGLIDPVAEAKANGTPITPDIIRAHNLTNKAAKTFLEDEVQRNDTMGKNFQQLVDDLKEGKKDAWPKLRSAMAKCASTPDSVFAFLETRFPDIKVLRTIRNELSDAHIAGRDKPIGFYREWQRTEHSLTNDLADRMAAVGVVRNMPPAEAEHFWDVAHGLKKPKNDAVARQVDQFLYELARMWKLRDQTGENIGYVEEAYVNRVFLKDVADNSAFHDDLLRLRVQEKNDLIVKLQSQRLATTDPAEIERLKAAVKRAQAIDPAKMTRNQIAKMKGLVWGEPVYLGAATEDSARERVFGPAADEILKDYYVKDPATLLQMYGSAAARGIAMRRRYGLNHKEVFQDWLNETALQLPRAYGELLKNAMEVSMGFRRDKHGDLTRMINGAANVTTASMLGRAVFPNISEPLNIFSRGLSVPVTFGALMKSMAPWMTSTSTRKRFATADRFGRLSGTLVDAASSMTAMAQHIGEDTVGNGILARFSVRAYWFNFMSSLTAGQQKIINRCAFELFYQAAAEIRKGGPGSDLYRQWFREHGISDPDAIAKFLEKADNIDNLDLIDTILPGTALTVANAVTQFVHTTIQHPTPSTKHMQANRGVIGVIFRLTSWITTNFINWAKYIKNRAGSALSGTYGGDELSLAQRWTGERGSQQLTAHERVFGRTGGTDITVGQRFSAMAAPAATALITMYVAQAFWVCARMALTNADEWEDRGDDDWERFTSRKTQLQIAQYWGVMGWLMNTAVDLVEGTRYNRGPAGVLAGPAYGGWEQDAERLMQAAVSTGDAALADKSVTQATKNNAAQASWHIGSTLFSMGLMNTLPASKTWGRALGFGWSVIGTSPWAQHEFADFLTGEKDAALRKRAKAGDMEADAELVKRGYESLVKKKEKEMTSGTTGATTDDIAEFASGPDPDTAGDIDTDTATTTDYTSDDSEKQQ